MTPRGCVLLKPVRTCIATKSPRWVTQDQIGALEAFAERFVIDCAHCFSLQRVKLLPHRSYVTVVDVMPHDIDMPVVNEDFTVLCACPHGQFVWPKIRGCTAVGDWTLAPKSPMCQSIEPSTGTAPDASLSVTTNPQSPLSNQCHCRWIPTRIHPSRGWATLTTCAMHRGSVLIALVQLVTPRTIPWVIPWVLPHVLPRVIVPVLVHAMRHVFPRVTWAPLTHWTMTPTFARHAGQQLKLCLARCWPRSCVPQFCTHDASRLRSIPAPPTLLWATCVIQTPCAKS